MKYDQNSIFNIIHLDPIRATLTKKAPERLNLLTESSYVNLLGEEKKAKDALVGN